MSQRTRRGMATAAESTPELTDADTFTVEQIKRAFRDWLQEWMAVDTQKWHDLSVWEIDALTSACWLDMAGVLRSWRDFSGNRKDDAP